MSWAFRNPQSATRKRVRRRNAWLIVLALVSIAAILLPGSWTEGLVSLVQVIVPFQDATSTGADVVAGAFERDAAPVEPAVHEALERERAALEHENASLALRVAKLEDEVGLLTATRLWGGREGGIGARGRLIPARVITEDILAWRSSRLINAGSLQGVRNGAAVASRLFTIDRGEDGGVRDGMAILRGEVLIGLVQQVGTHTARIKLLSDVSVEMKVRIGRFNRGGNRESYDPQSAIRIPQSSFAALDRFFWLTGRGDGIMEIREVDRRDVEAGAIQVGDIVLSDHSDDTLPAPMTIGKIVRIDPDREKPLLSTLTVKSSVDNDSLRNVYIFDPEGDAETR
ncbi:MAG: rod shape-determining protein MreC [Planctomycetota bacterium]|jgi:hypothetical protein